MLIYLYRWWTRNLYWFVVEPPLWKIWVRQLGWWHSQYMESHKIPWFQTTNQYIFIDESNDVQLQCFFRYRWDGLMMLMMNCWWIVGTGRSLSDQTYIHTYIYIYLFIFTYIYINIYIYLAIYIYTHKPLSECTKKTSAKALINKKNMNSESSPQFVAPQGFPVWELNHDKS